MISRKSPRPLGSYPSPQNTPLTSEPPLSFKKLKETHTIPFKEPQKLSTRTIRIICQEYGDCGFGDIAFCFKLVAILQRINPNYQLILQPFFEKTQEKINLYLKNHPLENVSLKGSEEPIESQDIVINGPAVQFFLDEKIPPEMEEKNIFNLGEYSSGLSKVHRLKELKKKLSLEQMIAIYKSQNKDLFMAEYIYSSPMNGVYFDTGFAPGSLGVFCKKLQKSPIQNSFLNTYNREEIPIFFGYAHEIDSLRTFITTCLFTQKNSFQDFDICLAGQRALSQKKRIDQNIQEWEKQFPHLKIKTYGIEDKEDLSISGQPSVEPEKGITVRIFFPGFISSSDMETLTASSHKGFVLTTGDQTVSESLECLQLIEIRGHKRNSIQDLIMLAQKNNFHLLADFVKLSFSPNPEKMALLIEDENLLKEAKEFQSFVEENQNI